MGARRNPCKELNHKKSQAARSGLPGILTSWLKLELLQGIGFVLELAEEKLQPGYFAQLDIGRE